MRKNLLAALFLMLGALSLWAQSSHGSPSTGREGWYENKGQIMQTDGQAAPYVSHLLERGSTKIFLLKPAGIAYQFERAHYPEGYKALMAEKHLDPEQMKQRDELSKQVRLETYRMDMYLEGANPSPQIEATGKSADYVQYYNHNVLDVHHYEKVVYREVYPNIDWVIYTTEEGIKYDFVVRPGGNPTDIKIRFKDQEELSVNAAGELVHGNRMGKFTEQRPVSFQGSKQIASSFVLEGNVLRFQVGSYDRSATLVIDPNREWGTYYGGAGDDTGLSCATDASGNVYLAGNTESTTNIASGGHQISYGSGYNDAFLVKFNAAGVRQWGTYYGEAGDDTGLSCATDASGNVYLAGKTNSTTNIASGGHQNTHDGSYDAFLVKFNSAGVRQWGTYYGGAGGDTGYSCAVDASGNVYLAGTTTSNTNIANGGHQNTYGGSYDAFLVKFNADGVRQWGSYYGGTLYDEGYSCATDASGNVYLAGETESTANIASGGHQNTYGGGNNDVFLVKFNADGVRQWGTYYGGTSGEFGYSCAADASGNVYLAGETYSFDIPSSGHQNTFGGLNDAFLVKFNADGVRQWGTYYGGTSGDFGYSCVVDASGNVYLAGRTSSTTNIVSGGYQNTNGGVHDAFLVKFNALGVRQWGTYYGGTNGEIGYSCAMDASGNIYLAGETNSTTDIASGGHQNTYGGNSDAFLVKFTEAVPLSASVSGTNALCGSDGSVNLTVSGGGTSYTFAWSTGASTEDLSNLGTGTYAVTVTDNLGATATATTTLTSGDAVAPAITCPANITANTANGACTAVVTFAATASDNCSATVTYSPASGSTFNRGTTTVTATATDGAGNTATCSFTVTVNDTQAPTLSCPGLIYATRTPGQNTGTATFAASVGDNCGSATVTFSPTSGSTFSMGRTTVTATATDAAGNTSTCTFTVVVTRYLYVDHTATAGNQNGLNWSNAYLTVQAALAAASSNLDTILVAAGNYSPGATATSTYTLKPRVPMFGGFPNGLNPATWSWGQRNVAANPTILNGNGVNRRVVTATNLGNDPVMCVFDGFTVRGANGNSVAGGMYIAASAAGQVCSPVVRNCTFENNNAVNGGGVGVVASSGTANPTFLNCAFTGNSTSVLGGGLYLGPTKAGSINAVLTDCSFANNSASSFSTVLARGGGLAAYSFGAGCTLTVTINGGSFSNNATSSFGGGLLNYARAGGISQVTVNGTVFIGNAASSGGGASLYCLGGQGTSTFNGANFNNNTASQGGGAANSYCELNTSLGNLVFEGCQFTNNLAGFAGGAISNSALKSAVSNATVSRCRFENNTAISRGGGVYALSTTNLAALPATSTTTNVTNSVFVGNNGGIRGGALYNESALGSLSNLQATNITVAGNTAQNGAALFNIAPGALVATATATNSIFWANTCTDTSSRYFHGVGSGCGVSLQNCVLPLAYFTSNEVGTGSFTDLGGNISASPLFVSIANGDLHLQAGSPCIDAGTAVALSVDIDGNARPQGAGFDMGAYETGITRPMARQLQTTASTTLTATVYPNPTTGTFTVALDREVTGFAQLFDLQGRLVAAEQLNGVNQAAFDLGVLGAGSYLLRIVSGDAVVTKQIVVARP